MRLRVTFSYDDVQLDHYSGVAPPDEYGAFLADLLPRGEGSALDLTAGSGFHAIVLSGLGYVVTAVDISSNAVEAVRKNAEANGVTVRVLQGDLYAAVARETFDIIVAWPPLMPTPEHTSPSSEHSQIHDGGKTGFDLVERVLEGARRALAPHGRLFTIRPWYLKEDTYGELLARFGLKCRTLASKRFPLGTLSTERLAYLCDISNHVSEDLYLNGQEMHVLEIKLR